MLFRKNFYTINKVWSWDLYHGNNFRMDGQTYLLQMLNKIVQEEMVCERCQHEGINLKGLVLCFSFLMSAFANFFLLQSFEWALYMFHFVSFIKKRKKKDIYIYIYINI